MADESVGFFFNVEKFFGSMAAQRMSFAEKGVYLVMLFQQWRDKARNLPDDPNAVADLIAVTTEQVAEVQAAWDVVRRKFVASNHSPDRIYNVEIENTRRKQRSYYKGKQIAGQRGGKTKASNRKAEQELYAKQKLAVLESARAEPSSALAHPSDKSSKEKSSKDWKGEEKKPGGGERKERPRFENKRFVVHRWQVEELISMLGAHADGFDLDEWLMTGAYLKAEQEVAVIPDWWKWLKAETLREAQRRGLPMAVTATEPTNKRIAGLVAGGQAFLNRTQR